MQEKTFGFPFKAPNDAVKIAEMVYWAGKYSEGEVEFDAALSIGAALFKIIFHDEKDAIHFKLVWG